jgi:subtilisin family serine protease
MRNFKSISLLLGVLFLSSAAFSGALVDPSLRNFAQGDGTHVTRVLILVNGQGSPNKPRRYDRANVIAYYKDAARRSAEPLLVSLQNNELPGVNVRNLYWINGAILADVTPAGLRQLKDHPSVTKIYKNNRMGFDPGLFPKFSQGRNPSLDQAAKDYAFPSIGLDKLIQEQPQVTGQGVIVGIVDTGVDATHPALQGKVPLFYNGETKATSEPKDFDSHGTHVSGTIVGGDRKTNKIGVAPGAKIVVAGVVEQGYDAMLEGMQWFLDVDKNPVVAAKIHAIGCSWNSGGAPDQEVFYRAIAAWEAAGILPVFSAGNSGMNGITPPHEYPGTLAVAAFGADGNIADFSSRGPGHYKGQDTQKPDLAAPGVDITSSIPGGTYESMSGTSMAQPHVTGTAALLLQVNPNLNPAQLREILVKSSVPAEGQTAGQWSPEYGFGKLNAYNAVKMVASNQLTMSQMFLNSLSISGPGALEEKGFEDASLGEVDGPADQFTDTDLSHWDN